MNLNRACFFSVTILLGMPLAVHAQDWDDVDFIQHSVYQAVNGDGTSAYPADGFPVKLRGVVLNNSEDLLDPTAAYTDTFQIWQMGGEAEFYVQVVDLPGDTWDDGDFGGTACWMGQNYGNLGWIGDPQCSYTDEEWYAELDRLQLWRPDGPASPLVRAGNLVEIRARAGLNYKGKMNVNEMHLKDSAYDFEIVILDDAYGLPSPTAISLSDIKDSDDAHIFDSTRATGGEHYQSTLVEIQDVQLVDTANWGCDEDLELMDTTGRKLSIHLGLNDSFATTPAPEGWFNVVGIMDQKSFNGTGGYRLLAMNAADFGPVVLPGDFDVDDDVDGADFLLWQRGFGTSYGASDLADWQEYFGASTGTAAVNLGQVPEPAALALLASGALMLLVGGCRSRRVT